MVVASDVGLIAGVVLLDKGINFGELMQAHVELVDVFVHPAKFGAVVQIVVLDLVDCIGSSENGADSKGSHL